MILDPMVKKKNLDERWQAEQSGQQPPTRCG